MRELIRHRQRGQWLPWVFGEERKEAGSPCWEKALPVVGFHAQRTRMALLRGWACSGLAREPAEAAGSVGTCSPEQQRGLSAPPVPHPE